MFLAAGVKADPDGYVGGAAPWVAKGRSAARPVKTYADDRTCGCGARLSIYNADPVCAPCSGERWAEH